ncbi:MAG: hypothetical protein PHY47_01135 [Lachnospiraceae bacterium]|nr:hypothetical protein [Lachnospiraceae bacterium]
MLKTSKEWSDIILTKDDLILDPDGWDRKNFHYSYEIELINLEEYKRRLSMSTMMCNMIDLFKRMNNVLVD